MRQGNRSPMGWVPSQQGRTHMGFATNDLDSRIASHPPSINGAFLEKVFHFFELLVPLWDRLK